MSLHVFFRLAISQQQMLYIIRNACIRKGDSIPKKHQRNVLNERTKSSGRPLNRDKEDAFSEICRWLEEYDEPVLVQELVDKMAELLPDNTEPYSVRRMQQKLEEHFSDNIVILRKEGNANMVTSGRTVANIIFDYQRQKSLEDPNEEKFRIVEAAANLIKAEIKMLYTSMEYYPSPEEISSKEENKKTITRYFTEILGHSYR